MTHDEMQAVAGTRGSMCRAIVREMHVEIHKHNLKKNGEDDIYETVPAICLAIVQNYTLTATPAPSSSWTLVKRAKKLDDEAEEDGPPDPEAFKHIMKLKKACEVFTDDFQQELSELMYKETYRKDPESIIEEFCEQPGVRKKYKAEKGGRKRQPGEKPKKAKSTEQRKKEWAEPKSSEDGAMPSMDDMLRKYDTDGSLSNLIEMERENPEAMLEPKDLAEVEKGSEQIRCDVCRAISKVTLMRAKKARALRDETQLTELVQHVCVGTPVSADGVYHNNEYPKYPGNPPLWGEMYTVKEPKEEGGSWRMLKLKKGAPIEEKSQGAGDVRYNYMVMKHSMISRSCKAVVAELEPDLPEVIYSKSSPEWTAKTLGEAYCAEVCAGQGDGAAKDEL